MWERSFVAVSVLVNEPLEQALAALPEDADVADLVAKLRDGRRPVRAAALAVVAQEVVLAAQDMTYR